ncbi:MAG: hypothetical protein HYW07_18615, partial [Candidatus Latescibacteria bacterium]|nr:hypothetical protein [Candidatus Latescibacterota bacterium]
RIAALIRPSGLERLTCFALLFVLGSLQLFFGYGESYTLVSLAVALYLLPEAQKNQGAP